MATDFLEKNVRIQRNIDSFEESIMNLDFKIAGEDKYRDLLDDMYGIQQKLTDLKQTMSLKVMEIE